MFTDVCTLEIRRKEVNEAFPDGIALSKISTSADTYDSLFFLKEVVCSKKLQQCKKRK